MDCDQILKLIRTENDRKEILDFIDSLCQDIYRSGHNIQQMTSSNQKFGAALVACWPQGLNQEPQALENGLRKLYHDIEALPTLRIVVAAEPTQKSVDALVQFAATKFPEKSIIDFEIDPKIMGGAVFIFNGRYLDLSVSKKLGEAFSPEGIQRLLESAN